MASLIKKLTGNFRLWQSLCLCLFTLPITEGQSHAAVSIDSYKAVIQRDTIPTIRLTFSLKNLVAEDYKTYELGKGQSEDIMRSLTKYLDICINTNKGTKCSAGADPKKIRYNATTNADTTPPAELREDFTASFNDSLQIALQPGDSSGMYYTIDVRLNLVGVEGNVITPASTFVSVRLLPGTATSNNFLDQDEQATLAVPVNGVVDNLAIISSRGTLTANWDPESLVTLADEAKTKSKPDGALGFVVGQSSWDSIEVPFRNYDAKSANAESSANYVCHIAVSDSTKKTCSFTCDGLGEGISYYIRQDDLKAQSFNVSASSNTGVLGITELDNATTYAFIYQNEPNGLVRSCRVGQPSDGVTLTEINGGASPKLSDPRCFIATAAYGSSLDPHLVTLRWFRDSYLLRSSYGSRLVNWYYEHSPPLAEWISKHPVFAFVVRILLWLPVLLLELWQSGWLPLFLASVGSLVLILAGLYKSLSRRHPPLSSGHKGLTLL